MARLLELTMVAIPDVEDGTDIAGDAERAPNIAARSRLERGFMVAFLWIEITSG